MLYISSQATGMGACRSTTSSSRARTSIRPRSGTERVAVAEPRLPEMCAASAFRSQGVARSHDGRAHALARRVARSAVHLELCNPLREGRARAHRRRGQRQRLRRTRLLDARLARPGPRCSPRPHTRRGRCRAQGVQPAGGRGRHQPAAGAFTRGLPAFGPDARTSHVARSIRRHRGQGGSRRQRRARARHRAG